MAFKRVIELSVGESGTGLLISDLDIEFNIERSITFSENTAEFTIYNAKESTRKEVLKEGNNIIFKSGYEDEGISTLFIGNITEAKSIQEGADWISTISASSIRSSRSPLENTYVTISYAPDALLNRPLRDIATALGLVLIGEDNALINLDNGFTFVGSARAALNYCKEILRVNGVELYIDNTEIVVYNVDNRDSRFSPIYLDYESGLLRVNDITEYKTQTAKIPRRISFESLIIPKMQPNGLININTDKINGLFLIEKLTFEGDNFGGENRCMGEAVE